MEKIFKPRNLSIIAVGLATIILIVGLFILRIGVADNGSLQSNLEAMGLYDGQMSVGSGYYSNQFGVMGQGTDLSTAHLAYGIGKIGVPQHGVVHVAVPAIIYSLMFLAGLFLIILMGMGKYKWNNILLAVLSVVMLADIGYISFFNTPYKEGAAFVYLILTVGLFMLTIRKESLASLILLGVSGLLFAGTMMTSACIGIVLGIFVLRLAFLRKDVLWKIISVIVSIVIVFSGIYTIISTDNSLDLYSSVFYGALKDSENAEDGLNQLGLSPELKEYVGVPSFEDKAQEFINADRYKTEFLDKVNYGKIGTFYLKNPREYKKFATNIANNSSFIRTSYLGNYPADSGRQPGEQAKFFSIYSTVKPKIVPSQLIALLVMFVIMLFFALQYRKKFAATVKDKILCELVIVGVISAFLMLHLPALFGGLSEISFKMNLYNAMVDLCILASVVGGTRMLAYRRDKLRETYGVNQ